MIPPQKLQYKSNKFANQNKGNTVIAHSHYQGRSRDNMVSGIFTSNGDTCVKLCQPDSMTTSDAVHTDISPWCCSRRDM